MSIKTLLAFLLALGIIAWRADAAFFQGAVNGPAAAICVDSVPSVAVTYGFNTCTYAVDLSTSLSAVDVNDTGGTNFKLWIHAFQSNACVQPSTDFTIAQSSLRIAPGCSTYPGQVPALTTIYLPAWVGVTGSWNAGIATYVTPTANTFVTGDTVFINSCSNALFDTVNNGQGPGTGVTITVIDSTHFTAAISNPFGTTTGCGVFKGTSGWKGYSFTNGFLRRITFAFDETKAVSNQNFPSFWTQNYMNQPANDNLEIDGVDFLPATGSNDVLTFLHEWIGSSNNSSTAFTPQARSTYGNPTLDGAHFYALDQLWVPTSKNGGTGIFQTWWWDGTTYYHLTNYDQQYTLSGGASPAATPSNPSGVFSIAETGGYFPFWITAGNTNQPLYIRNIQVWQTSVGDLKTQ